MPAIAMLYLLGRHDKHFRGLTRCLLMASLERALMLSMPLLIISSHFIDGIPPFHIEHAPRRERHEHYHGESQLSTELSRRRMPLVEADDDFGRRAKLVARHTLHAPAHAKRHHFPFPISPPLIGRRIIKRYFPQLHTPLPLLPPTRPPNITPRSGKARAAPIFPVPHQEDAAKRLCDDGSSMSADTKRACHADFSCADSQAPSAPAWAYAPRGRRSTSAYYDALYRPRYASRPPDARLACKSTARFSCRQPPLERHTWPFMIHSVTARDKQKATRQRARRKCLLLQMVS